MRHPAIPTWPRPPPQKRAVGVKRRSEGRQGTRQRGVPPCRRRSTSPGGEGEERGEGPAPGMRRVTAPHVTAREWERERQWDRRALPSKHPGGSQFGREMGEGLSAPFLLTKQLPVGSVPFGTREVEAGSTSRRCSGAAGPKRGLPAAPSTASPASGQGLKAYRQYRTRNTRTTQNKAALRHLSWLSL